jgi:hypothetical protein
MLADNDALPHVLTAAFRRSTSMQVIRPWQALPEPCPPNWGRSIMAGSSNRLIPAMPQDR